MFSPKESDQLKERFQKLEADIRQDRHYIYEDLPFAIFCYAPHLEWPSRQQIRLLRTRLEKNQYRRVHMISLADLLWQAVAESESLNAIAALEGHDGFDMAQRQVFRYLTDPIFRPLRDLLADRLHQLDPERDIAFIWRTGALAPNLYRVSKLLDEMKVKKVRVSCVLWMPAISQGDTVLRFMGLEQDEGRGSYHTQVYTD